MSPKNHRNACPTSERIHFKGNQATKTVQKGSHLYSSQFTLPDCEESPHSGEEGQPGHSKYE